MAVKLTALGLPVKPLGNAGQGGPDRRGVEEPNRRPASVKVGKLGDCPQTCAFLLLKPS